MPEKLNTPDKKISTLKEIWHGKELKKVRDMHLQKKINNIEICKNCSYKESYHWKKI